MQKQTAGYCIYCGDANGPLTREHIIPYSMGGGPVLQAASCLPHALITSQLEQEIARNAYGLYRAENNFPSRNSKNYVTTLNRKVTLEGITFNDEKVELEIRASDLPSMPIFVHLNPPGILLDKSPDDLFDVTTEVLPSKGLRQLREKHGLKEIRGPVSSFPLSAFSRFLAKVGHAFSCSVYARDQYHPFLQAFILEGPGGGPHYVGGFNPRLNQSSELLKIREEIIGNQTLVVVEISLKQFPFMPRYQVVCGELKSESAVA